MRGTRARVILPAGQLRHLGGLHLGGEAAEDAAATIEPAVGLGRWLGGLSAWLSLTAFCALGAHHQLDWVPLLNQDLEEPIAALRDAAEAPVSGVARRASAAFSPLAVPRRTNKPVPGTVTQVTPASPQTEPAREVTALGLPPVPQPRREFTRWSLGQQPEMERPLASTDSAEGAAPSLAAAASLVGAGGAMSPRRGGCVEGGTGACADGSWGDSVKVAAHRPAEQEPLALAVERRAPERPRGDSVPRSVPSARDVPREQSVAERSVARPPAVEAAPVSAVAGQSCEAAFAGATQRAEFGTPSKNPLPDVPQGTYAALLEREPFAECRLDIAVDIRICVAVKNGHAEGVTVTTQPGSAALSRCVARRVRALNYPRSNGMDLVRTEITIR